MNKYSVRPAKSGDIDAVFDLIANQRTLDFGGAMMSMDDLRSRWELLNLNEDTVTAFSAGHYCCTPWASFTGADSKP